MSDLFRLIWYGLIGLFRSRAALEAEILLLRHQLNILRRATPKRVALGSIDRLVFVGLYRLAPGVLESENCNAGNPDSLAPNWPPRLLALEIPTARRPAEDTNRHSQSYSRDEYGEPALGSTADPRRAAQAPDRRRADAADALCCQDGRSGTAESIEHDVAA